MTGKSPQADSAAPFSDGSALAPVVPPSNNGTLTPLVPPSSSSSYPSSSQQSPYAPLANAMQDEELKAAKAQVAAHRGDLGWIMSSEG